MPLLPGRRLGPYEIEAALGAGGMGEVYRARDIRLGREVAIKVLPTEVAADAERLRRFEREAQLLASLSHANVLALHDVGREGETVYAVTELLVGETLRERLASGLLPARKALEVGVGIAHGLAAAHARGIVHRDLKPENVFLTRDGQPKVLDFGLATLEPLPRQGFDIAASGAPTLARTQPGTLLGTVGYMAPEQIRGEAADARSDIFSFGLVLHEMLTGKQAFARATAVETMAAILREDPPDPIGLVAGLPSPLVHVLRRCLEKRPEERFESAHDLAFALEAAASTLALPPDAPRRRRRRLLLAGSTLTSVGAAGLVAYLVAHALERHAPPAIPGVVDSLAVLPLVNLSGDVEQEYFADGMTEELIAALSRVEGLRVVSRTSAFAFKGKNADVRVVGEELGVGTVLEGSVRKAGDRLRVTVQLVDAKNGYHLWSEVYDRELSDVFAVQEETSQAVVRALAARLGAAGGTTSSGQLARRGTEDLDAYELYLQGRYLTNKWAEESVRRGIAYFERAIDRDPHFARAHAGLADAYMWLLWDGSVEEALPRAREAARRALELDGSLSEAHYALARILSEIDWDWPSAEKEFRHALELDSANGEARHRYAHLLVALERYAEATAESLRLIELDPLNAEWHHHLGWNYLFSREYALAEAPYRKALELDPNTADTMGYLGVLFVEQGRFPEAIEMFRAAVDRHGANGETLSHLAWGYAMVGDAAAARAVMREVDRGGILVPAWRMAYVHAALGEGDQAFEWLERAFVERRTLFQAVRDPRFDPLRQDPRFEELVRRMNLPT